jgi:hypothetical protein
VVTPSNIPRSFASFIWLKLAVSIKNFMVFYLLAKLFLAIGFDLTTCKQEI